MTQTHIYIAKRIWQNIKNDNIFFNINKSLFLYGNIEPDIPITKVSLPHKREEALNFVLSEIDKLKNMNIKTKEDMKKFSLNVGIICHFLSDFYCMPHVERWGDFTGLKRTVKGIEHISYEFKISFYKDEVKKALENDYEIFDNPETFLMESFEMYKKDTNIKKDVYYATNICNNIVHHIWSKQKSLQENQQFNFI